MQLVISDIREEGLDKAEASLTAACAGVAAVVADVSDEASVRALADRTIAAYGRVDLVSNNADVVSPPAPMREQEARIWELMIGVKVLGAVHGVNAPPPDLTPYTTTMHAVVGLTETFDQELKRAAPTLGATVLCPGLVETSRGQNSAALGAINLQPGAPISMQIAAARFGGKLSPREVAGSAIAAIEADRVHVAPGGNVAERAQARVTALLADISAR
ncbi:SDR family NAD(P)-dependent oxidoreductase [Streptomyces sp. NPDC012616]|uniref:SDR family NAD(P)-dependent oxidoreductase n=1 Tax=Streptomyces sp. NPDC012616 TaxID=3364840 RepID=UPI0036E6C568